MTTDEQAEQRQVLRVDSVLVASVFCLVCRREPIMDDRGGGTLMVCRHVFDSLKMFCELTGGERPPHVATTRIAVFDDEDGGEPDVD